MDKFISLLVIGCFSVSIVFFTAMTQRHFAQDETVIFVTEVKKTEITVVHDFFDVNSEYLVLAQSFPVINRLSTHP